MPPAWVLGSRNNVVRLWSISQSNTFISLAELTFEFIIHRKSRNGSCILHKHILSHVQAHGCSVQLYGDDMGISKPVKSCLLYAVVTGPSWQAVDRHTRVWPMWVHTSKWWMCKCENTWGVASASVIGIAGMFHTSALYCDLNWYDIPWLIDRLCCMVDQS